MGSGFPQSGRNQTHAAFALGQAEGAFHLYPLTFIQIILRTEAECERRLAEMIAGIKAEIAQERAMA